MVVDELRPVFVWHVGPWAVVISTLTIVEVAYVGELTSLKAWSPYMVTIGSSLNSTEHIHSCSDSVDCTTSVL